MAKYLGDALFQTSLEVLLNKPLDVRTVVDSIEGLYDTRFPYEGMTVANLGDGNMYMLKDITKVGERAGWQASYETLLIITCTLQEYQEWERNTNFGLESNSPIGENKKFLNASTYYYIYEDSLEDSLLEDLKYLPASWGRSILELVNAKAEKSSLDLTNTNLSELQTVVSNNYTEFTDLKNYTNLDDENSEISKKFKGYYDSSWLDEYFVTFKDLGGDSSLSGDNFIFVKKSDFDVYTTATEAILNKTLKTDEEGALKSLKVELIVSPGEKPYIIDITSEGIGVTTEENEFDPYALTSVVPKLKVVNEIEYNSLLNPEEGLPTFDPDTYYFVWNTKGDVDEGYVTNTILESYEYQNAAQVGSTISSLLSTYDKDIRAIEDKKLNLKIDDLNISLSEEISNLDTNLGTQITTVDSRFSNYADSATIASTYATKDELSGNIKNINDSINAKVGEINSTIDSNKKTLETTIETLDEKVNTKVDTNTFNTLIDKTLPETYVTIDSITGGTSTEDGVKYSFLTNDEFKDYTESIAKEFKSNSIDSESVKTSELNLTDVNDKSLLLKNVFIEETSENILQFGEERLATLKEVPKILILDLDEYDNKESFEEDTYYMTYFKDGNNRYVELSDFDSYQAIIDNKLSELKNINNNINNYSTVEVTNKLSEDIVNINSRITSLEESNVKPSIEDIEGLNEALNNKVDSTNLPSDLSTILTTNSAILLSEEQTVNLVELIKSLNTKISELETKIQTLESNSDVNNEQIT